MEELRAKDLFCALRGWRNENYDVKTRFSDPPLMCIERAAADLLGIIHYGVHVNGYFYNDSGELMMWIGRRSPNKPTYPNMLDNMCAGGLASGLGVRECMMKECGEEASVEDDDLNNLVAVGTVSYCYEDERGVFPECQFVFDLELTSDFVPENADGEVGSFEAHPISKVQELIVTNEFKPNCSLVILDFLIRHGIISPENEPHYVTLVEQIHKPLLDLYS
ncbi:hypothetical protein SNE40_013645 [Patella caerulea]|uniref:Nudix hydrolase domain-containing protein n=1 Tax=Patella caerulea TaxID=87958 RepID=A0AAN8JDW3_PATCE